MTREAGWVFPPRDPGASGIWFNLILYTKGWTGAGEGSRTTLFYALPVEVGFDAPALRPREFSDVLNEIVREIRITAAKPVS
jgi:hypothetical protein